VLPENTIVRPSDHARFQREVETWGRLRADHLVRLYDSGFTETNAPYMALEYIAGGALSEYVQQHGPLPIEMARTAAIHALRALKAAHAANVLHRDITPDALVLDQRPDGSPFIRLTGFGLAKHLGDEEDDPTAITMTGQVVGNPAYMAPETIMQGILDPRTDLYALGVALYELTAGRRPFAGASLADMLAAHIQGRPEPLDRYRPDAPVGFRAFIGRLLERNPEDRLQSAEEALAALEYVPNAAAGELAAWPEYSPVEAALTVRRKRRWPWVLAGAGLLALGAVLGMIVVSL
ncbi:MAG: serine/threonine protein kinase, partial [Myxococcales bacterium]|nr:serine/threonine protein kinase [Myxococcales bacterium]